MRDDLAPFETPPKAVPDIDQSIVDDVMIDIETMAVHPSNALILSIGLLRFDPTRDKLVLGDRKLLRPDLIDQLLLGRGVEESTQKFWREQSKTAQDDWRIGNRYDLKVIADEINDFTQGCKRLWANGIMFDLGNVVTMMRQAGKVETWHYRAPRDMRTFCAETPMNCERATPPDVSGVAHAALYDCEVQAYRVWQHWPSPAHIAHHPV